MADGADVDERDVVKLGRKEARAAEEEEQDNEKQDYEHNQALEDEEQKHSASRRGEP